MYIHDSRFNKFVSSRSQVRSRRSRRWRRALGHTLLGYAQFLCALGDFALTPVKKGTWRRWLCQLGFQSTEIRWKNKHQIDMIWTYSIEWMLGFSFHILLDKILQELGTVFLFSPQLPWGPFSSAEGLLGVEGVVSGDAGWKMWHLKIMGNEVWKKDCLIWLISLDGSFVSVWVNSHGKAWGWTGYSMSGAAMWRNFELPSWSAQCPMEPTSPSRRTA